MSEYILKVDDVGAAAQIIKMFGIEETRIYGHSFTGEQIVRCRDCINLATDELGNYCTLLDFQDAKSMSDGFCAWGMRKEDDE